MKGSYILVLNLENDKTILIGKKEQKMFFKKGFYIYIGSAMNGLEQRISRHLKINKKFHWHIDFLLKYSEIKNVYFKESTKQEECSISKNFEQKFEKIDGFGSSDCKCKSHLFYGEYSDLLLEIEELHMSKYVF